MPRSKKPKEPILSHYFVDEAGDGTLFNRRGKVIIGTEGCSQFFMLGLLHAPDPTVLQTALDTLRSQLLADPYFKKIPSMQPQHRKTAFAFHAKDDLPEIRREVFKILMEQQGLRFFAVVRDKQSVLTEVQRSTNRYSPNDLYDKTVSRLFKSRLHKEDGYFITFAKRGSSDRTIALKTALETARQRAAKSWKVNNEAPINIKAIAAAASGALQAADYILWALQRLYEKREDRYIEYVWPIYRLVHDVDDTRDQKYGAYYNKKNPIELGKLKPL